LSGKHTAKTRETRPREEGGAWPSPARLKVSPLFPQKKEGPAWGRGRRAKKTKRIHPLKGKGNTWRSKVRQEILRKKEMRSTQAGDRRQEKNNGAKEKQRSVPKRSKLNERHTRGVSLKRGDKTEGSESAATLQKKEKQEKKDAVETFPEDVNGEKGGGRRCT